MSDFHLFGFLYKIFLFNTLKRLFRHYSFLDGWALSYSVIDCRPLYCLCMTYRLFILSSTDFDIYFPLTEVHGSDFAARFELKCSFEDFVAVDHSVLWLTEHWRPVQWKLWDGGYMCQQQMTSDSYFFNTNVNCMSKVHW